MNLLEDFDKMCVTAMKDILSKGFVFNKNKLLQSALTSGAPLTKEQIDEIAINYYNVIERIPRAVKREVYECSGVACPADLQGGYETLKEELKEGVDLLPRMSRQIKKIDFKDGMWSDWGIYHFHLGIGPDATHHDMTQGTSMIAYVYLSPFEDKAYIIRIDQHSKWTDETLLEELLSDYSDALDKWENKDCKGISANFHGADRDALRSCNWNGAIEVKGRYFISPWAGVTTNGISVRARLRLNKDREFVKNVENTVQRYLSEHVQERDSLGALHLKSFSARANNSFASLWDEEKGVGLYVDSANAVSYVEK